MAYKPIPNPATWTQADWYVDFVAGNDKNDGLAPATAVKTVMGGVVAKWGTTSPDLAQTTTIHILTPQPLNAEEIVLTPTLIGAVNFNIIGTPVLANAFALGAVTAKNRATNTSFAAAGFPGGTTAGQLVHNTTIGKDSWCFVRAFGVNTTLTQPLATITPGVTPMGFPPFPNPAEVNTWAIGDTVDVFDLPLLNLRSVEVQCTSVDAAHLTPGVWLQNLRIPDSTGTPGTQIMSPSAHEGFVVSNNCWFDPFMSIDSNQNAFVNCYFKGGGAVSEGFYGLGGIFAMAPPAPGFTIAALAQIDGDLIVETTTTLGVLNGTLLTGAIQVDGFVVAIYNCVVQQSDFVYGPGTGIWWGVGQVVLDDQAAFSNKNIPAGGTWVTTNFVATLALAGAAGGGTSFDAGWVNDIPVTQANLDTWGDLQNPNNGARFTTV